MFKGEVKNIATSEIYKNFTKNIQKKKNERCPEKEKNKGCLKKRRKLL